MNHFALFKFYGVDWLAMCLQLTSIYALGGKRREGFLIAMLSSIGWAAFGIMTGSIADILANLLFIGMNVHSYWRWSNGKHT